VKAYTIIIFFNKNKLNFIEFKTIKELNSLIVKRGDKLN